MGSFPDRTSSRTWKKEDIHHLVDENGKKMDENLWKMDENGKKLEQNRKENGKNVIGKTKVFLS